MISSATPVATNTGEIRNTTIFAVNPPLTIAAPTYTFAMLSTSLIETNSSNVVAGETITMQVALTLPQGTTPATSVNFSLPNALNQKLVVSSGRVTYKASTMQNALNGAQLTLLDKDNDGENETANFYFGDITNVPDNVRAGVDDTILIELIAVVPKNNTRGTKLVLNATVFYNGTYLPSQSMFHKMKKN